MKSPRIHKELSYVVPQGQFEFLVCPFGLKNAPSVFQRFMSTILADFITDRRIAVFLDDIVFGSKTLVEHSKLLAEVLERLAQFDIRLNLAKCKFAHHRIDYLGYSVSSAGLRPTDRHVMAIKSLPYPKDAKELQRAVELFSYFRMFIKSFSTIAKPLRMMIYL